MAPWKQKWFMPISQRSITNRSPRLLRSPKILICNLKSACKSLLRLSEAEVLLPWDTVDRPQTWLMSSVILAGSAAQSEKGYFNHGQKSWDWLLHFWVVFQFTQVQPLPSPHKQCWTRVSRIFFEFQFCIGWEEGELQEIFEKDALF